MTEVCRHCGQPLKDRPFDANALMTVMLNHQPLAELHRPPIPVAVASLAGDMPVTRAEFKNGALVLHID